MICEKARVDVFKKVFKYYVQYLSIAIVFK